MVIKESRKTALEGFRVSRTNAGKIWTTHDEHGNRLKDFSVIFLLWANQFGKKW